MNIKKCKINIDYTRDADATEPNPSMTISCDFDGTGSDVCFVLAYVYNALGFQKQDEEVIKLVHEQALGAANLLALRESLKELLEFAKNNCEDKNK